MDTKSLKNLLGYKISAIDGEIGKVKNFYFDNKTLTVRYLVAETGSLFFGRKVMISTQALINAEWEKQHFLTNMTIQQIENSPKVEEGKRLTRGQEIQLHNHYKWTNYWNSDTQNIYEQSVDHLLALQEITDFRLAATDGEVGNIRDLLINENNWTIDFIVIDAFQDLPAKEITLSSKWIAEIDADKNTVFSNHTKSEIKNNPSFNPEKISI